jgi:hypothetical protein
VRAADVGNSKVIGGMALEFYKANARNYDSNSTEPDFRLEPHVALAIFQGLVKDSGVSLFQHAAVDKVTMDPSAPTKIKSVTTVDGRTFEATVFVEADYEGDLMARAGASGSGAGWWWVGGGGVGGAD